MENEIGNYLQVFVWRTPKKNRDALMKLCEPAKKLFKNLEVKQEIFLLKENSEEQKEMCDKMGFTNIAKAVSANKDEDVWLELQFYRGQKHLQEVSEKMNKDESANQLGRQFMDLITPKSCAEGWFSHFNF
jgi:uncharacterized protein YbaA (DUF1428 family)